MPTSRKPKSASDKSKSTPSKSATRRKPAAKRTNTSRKPAKAARKTRSPHYLERFAWLPLEVTAGLADGNNYVGDVDLDPEISYEVELGLDWRGSALFVAPRAFYRNVDDYIQGVPVDATPGVIDSPLEMRQIKVTSAPVITSFRSISPASSSYAVGRRAPAASRAARVTSRMSTTPSPVTSPMM